MTRNKPSGRLTEIFFIKIVLHQRLTLNSCLFILAMDEFSEPIQNTLPYYMLFANDIVLVDVTCEEGQAKHKSKPEMLEVKDFRVNKGKIYEI